MDSCWYYAGLTNQFGYGRVRWRENGKDVTMAAHRVMYINETGEIPNGLPLDHLCRTRICINPAHLEAVTQKENIARGESGKHLRDRTECLRGHPYTEANTYRYPDGRRNCRTCYRERKRQRYARLNTQ